MRAALLDNDPERALAAVQAYRGDPRSLVRAAAFEDACRLLPEWVKDEAVGYLDEALRLQSAAGAERDAARVRRLLRDCGAQRAGGRPDPAAAHWPELTASELAVVRLVIRGATDREHRGTCGKARVVPHNRRPGSEFMEWVIRRCACCVDV